MLFDVCIIGCGITGAACAYELARYDLAAVILEKENDVSQGATKANSAIIHAGYDPEPGTLMAKLNVEGARLAKELFDRLDVPHRACGSMVVAFSEGELQTLAELFERGQKNGVIGLRLLTGEEARAMEPNLNDTVVGALLAPTAMICSPWEYALALAETAVRNGAKLCLNHEVTGITPLDGAWQIETNAGPVRARFILNAAGVHADKIHNMAAPKAFTIIPDRGAYYLFDKSEGKRVSRVIFPCPTKVGKGTLVTPTVHGNLMAGPNNEPPQDGEDVATTGGGLAQIRERAQKSVPGVDFRASTRNFSGIRAASDRDDFIIEAAEGVSGFIDLAGIKSPGLSAAPAIARMAVELLREQGLECVPKRDFTDSRKRVRFAELPLNEKRALIAKNPAYGRVVCRCETITEGEILDALDTPIPPRTLDGVKRRCNAGMGRCQGGFCAPRVLELLSDKLGVDPADILQDKAGTYILTGDR